MTAKEIRYKDKISSSVYFAKQLDSLGFQRKYTAYYLLIEIMNVLINDELRVKSFSKQVYPGIAKKYGKTECTIERNIRNLINVSWSKDLMVKLNVYYPEDKKPTCCEFIYMVKNYITKQIV